MSGMMRKWSGRGMSGWRVVVCAATVLAAAIACGTASAQAPDRVVSTDGAFTGKVVGTSAEALEVARTQHIDVALLDLALGEGELTGIELGIRIRELRADVGIVLLSQHVVPDFIDQLPDRYREGWSFIAKRADLRLPRLTEVLVATSRGLNVVDPEILAARREVEGDPVEALTPRQREIMALAASGRDATAIATELSLAPGTVRQELSKAYAVLVPQPTPGTDLRTSAVLAYLRATHAQHRDRP